MSMHHRYNPTATKDKTPLLYLKNSQGNSKQYVGTFVK
jgi:hypothetical protein